MYEGCDIKIYLNEEDLPQTATVVFLLSSGAGERRDSKERALVYIEGRYKTVNKKDCCQRVEVFTVSSGKTVEGWLEGIVLRDLNDTLPDMVVVGTETNGRVNLDLCHLSACKFLPTDRVTVSKTPGVYRPGSDKNIPQNLVGPKGWFWQFHNEGFGSLKDGDRVMVRPYNLPWPLMKRSMISATVHDFRRCINIHGDIREDVVVRIDGKPYYVYKHDCCQTVKVLDTTTQTLVDGWLDEIDVENEMIIVRYAIKGQQLRKQIPIECALELLC